MVESNGEVRRIKGSNSISHESLILENLQLSLTAAEKHVAGIRQAVQEPSQQLTFARSSTARSVCRQHRGSSEGSLQVIVLLCQLLQGLFQADTLVPFVLQGLLPLFTVGLG